MKKKDVKEQLRNLIRAMGKIEEYVDNLGFEEFMSSSSEMRLDAILRQLDVIGTIAESLPKSFLEQHSDLPIPEAIASLSFILGPYEGPDLETIWATIQRDLPPLKEKVLKIIEAL
jgi:uncharacterized protein with HEPN domain